MQDILQRIAACIERGKASLKSLYPPDMKGQEGVAELTEKALKEGISAQDVLNKGLIFGMHSIGEKFSRGDVFIPDLLIAAQAMNAAMELLRPRFESGEIHHKGTFIIGTVSGDLHDIGKNIVKIVMEGAGWEVTDLGTDTSTESFMKAIKNSPGALVGMSALLTTTMLNMEKSVRDIHVKYPHVKVIIGGAPITENFRKDIGADLYFPDPNKLVEYFKAGN